jgi:hypothetical protein|tara:strand:+ start:875 stop:1618 length:744 start_codon:yes stop_codon:yes gene_type:complete
MRGKIILNTKEELSRIQFICKNEYYVTSNESTYYYEFSYHELGEFQKSLYLENKEFKEAIVHKKLTSVTLLKSTTYGFHEFYISMLNYTIGDKVYYNEHLKINKHNLLSEIEIIGILSDREPKYLKELKWDLISLRDSLRENVYEEFQMNILTLKRNLELIKTSMTDHTGHDLGDGYIFILDKLYNDSLVVHGKSIQQRLILGICKKICTECIIKNGSDRRRDREPYNLDNALSFLTLLSLEKPKLY